MDFKDPIYNRFFAALKHELKTKWKRKQTTLGKEAGISSSFMSDIVNKITKAAYENRAALAKVCGYEYEDFIEYGAKLLGHKKKTDKNIIYFDNKTDKLHCQITKQFQQKTLAIKINQTLLELEKINKEELEEALFNLNNRLEFKKSIKKNSVNGVK